MTARNTAFITTIIIPEFHFRTFYILTSNTVWVMTWFPTQCIKVTGTHYIITGALQPSVYIYIKLSMLDAQQIKEDIHKNMYNTFLCLHSLHTSLRYRKYYCYFSSSSNLYTVKICIRLYEVVLLLLENKRKWFSIKGLWQ